MLRGFCPTAGWEKKREHSPLFLKVIWVLAAGRVQIFLVPAGWGKTRAFPLFLKVLVFPAAGRAQVFLVPAGWEKRREHLPLFMKVFLAFAVRGVQAFTRGAAVTRRRRLRI